MGEGLFALAGVAVGVLLNAIVNAIRDRTQRKSTRSEVRRLEVLDLVSAFLRDADTVWLGHQRLKLAIVEIQADRASPRGHEERQAAFAEMYQPRRDAMLAIGRMRLVSPLLVPSASALLTASETYNVDRDDGTTLARERAMRELEDLVRPMVA